VEDRPRLAARIVARQALDEATRDAMWACFAETYTDVERARFEHDLDAKSHVILLIDARDGAVRGFSTQRLFDVVVGGRTVQVLYSGDTVLARAYWGQTALQRAFLRLGLRAALQRPFTPTYWYLISKGYKTYLLLARNFPEHWPRYDRPTPPWQAALLDHLGTTQFGDSWDARTGVLQHPAPLGRLRDDVAPVEPELLEHPDVRFFSEQNPGHALGDELCCLGHVGLDLWASYTAKLVRRALGRRRHA
jgi:hypothetical protein